MHDHWQIIERVRELTGGTFCDRVIEAVGKQWPLDLAAELTREGGRLVIAGYHQDGPRQVNMQLWNWRGFDVVNAHERDPACRRARACAKRSTAIERGLDRSASADHPSLSARPARRGARRDARPAGQFRQGRASSRRDPARASSAPAGSAATEWKRCSRPARRWPSRSAIPIRKWRQQAQALAPLALEAESLESHARTRARRRGDRDAERAARRAMHPGVRSRRRGVLPEAARPHRRRSARRCSMRRGAPTACSASTSPTATPRRCRRSATAFVPASSGNVFAADLTFHNAYGPRSGWFWDPKLSGGGCLIDLGVHLVDLALWMFDFPEVVEAPSDAAARRAARSRSGEVEDYAVGELKLGQWRARPHRLLVEPQRRAGRGHRGELLRHRRRRADAQRERLVLRLLGRFVQRPQRASASRRRPTIGAAARRRNGCASWLPASGSPGSTDGPARDRASAGPALRPAA